jgi:glycerol-3-phosphate acyltransferase PlsY
MVLQGPLLDLIPADEYVVPFDVVLVLEILAAVFVGYLLGSIPCAHIAARLRGRDIFETGSTLAGAANVFWNIGPRTGTLVFAGDVAKGAAAVLIATRVLGVPDHLVLIVAGAAILGHWKSVFSGFRGGDGMATLMGLTIAMEPRLAPIGVVTGLAFVLLLWRTSYRSAWGIVACFTLMLALSLFYQMERGLVLGLTFLASLVLLRSTLTRRRRGVGTSGDKDIDLDLDEELDLEGDLDGDPDLRPRSS